MRPSVWPGAASGRSAPTVTFSAGGEHSGSDRLVLFQAPNIEKKAPWCFYPEDYGYSVKSSQETTGGMTAEITRNTKYRSSGRPDSPDINTLRVQIHYHTSHMLQFKVSAFFVVMEILSHNLLFTETSAPPRRSGIRPRIATRSPCR